MSLPEPLSILFVCTHNRCRSILCEAIANHLSTGEVKAVSAGSQPEGAVHPLTLHYLAEKGITTENLVSQSWDAFSDSDIDLVITVCDQAANETCPVWIGSATKLHWGLNDASKAPEAEQAQAFHALMEEIEQRVQGLLVILRTHHDKAQALKALTEANS